MPPLPKPPAAIYFGPFHVTPQVFHTTPHSFCLVNLKPLLPGHILVSPLRRVPRLSDLSPTEISDLFLTVQRVGRMITRVFKAEALNVAVQDGKAAGQSVEHVHAHVIPRREGDMESRGGGDRLYEMLEGEEGDVGGAMRGREGMGEKGKKGIGKKDEERMPRGEEEMRREAEWLREEMDKEEAV